MNEQHAPSAGKQQKNNPCGSFMLKGEVPEMPGYGNARDRFRDKFRRPHDHADSGHCANPQYPAPLIQKEEGAYQTADQTNDK